VPHLVVAPDKFRGTASAGDVAAAAAGAARRAGWTADEVPMSDGGEGLLQAVGGRSRHTTVSGPLGQPVDAEWRLLTDGSRSARDDPGPTAPDDPGRSAPDEPGTGPLTAVIEMSKASGRALVPHPHDEDPVDADTTGVGQLLLAARDAGARRIVVGCGGSATTDGGWGAFVAVTATAPDALPTEPLRDVELVVACDVTTPFLQAATVFGPQKGATEEQIVRLTARLEEIAVRYRALAAVDVTTIPGAGAAGGLAGGLVALGARIEAGFDLVARIVHLAERLERADLVITGEGHVDPPSFEGKVPGGVLHLARSRTGTGTPAPVSVVCIGGGADLSVLADPPPGLEVISLTAEYGPERARNDTLELIAEVTTRLLPRFCP
jgi:glycerate kinase